MGRKHKQAVRDDMRRILSNIDGRWLSAASHELCHQLTRLLLGPEGNSVECVLGWAPYFRGEPDLAPAIAKLLKEKRVFLPRLYSDHEMKFVEVEHEDWSQQLEKSDAGVFHPPVEDHSHFFSEKLAGAAVVLVPGLAFDADGARIGRGKGFYDRFLGKPEMHPLRKIGICWSLQVVPVVPTEEHDVSMDILCHERGIQYLR